MFHAFSVRLLTLSTCVKLHPVLQCLSSNPEVAICSETSLCTTLLHDVVTWPLCVVIESDLGATASPMVSWHNVHIPRLQSHLLIGAAAEATGNCDGVLCAVHGAVVGCATWQLCKLHVCLAWDHAHAGICRKFSYCVCSIITAYSHTVVIEGAELVP